MLKRVYIDNYKSCVDFSVEFGPVNLLMGINGAGKTTVFDVLFLLQRFTRAESALEELFSTETLTRWDSSSPVQVFGLSIGHQKSLYEYELAIEHNLGARSVQIKSERLTLDGKELLHYAGNALRYHVAHETEPLNVENIRFTRTTLDAIPENSNTSAITWFRKRLERFIVVQINPISMAFESQIEERILERRGENFVSWYRYITNDLTIKSSVDQELMEVFDEFREFDLIELGEHSRRLEARFRQNGRTIQYRFSELSEGQRTLTVLYSLIAFAKSKDYTICIDEPGNYLALQEVQPWLVQLCELCDDNELQALLISHHPELINYLVFWKVGIWFQRNDGASPTKAIPFPDQSESELPVAELVARGWIDE